MKVTNELLRRVALSMRRDSHPARAAHIALILGRSRHEDADAALAETRSLIAGQDVANEILDMAIERQMRRERVAA